MPGAPDPLYVLARRVLLDALQALVPQRKGIILVGAQAIYLHTGEIDLAVAPFTTDGDIAINPSALQPEPKLEQVLTSAGFRPTPQPGIWSTSRSLGGVVAEVTIDLLVPELVGGSRRRAAHLREHGDRVARKVRGIEAALVDNGEMTITSLEECDSRSFPVAVAGPAALLVAKLHKLNDRVGTDRANDKDALDALRLLRAVPALELAAQLRMLTDDPIAGEVTQEALAYLQDLFSNVRSSGSQMAGRAAAPLENKDTIAASCAALTQDLLKSLER